MTRFLTALAAGAALMAQVASASAQERWRMIAFAGENSIYVQDLAKPFAEHVKRLTGGKVEIQVVPSGVIAPPFQEFNAILDGQAEAGLVTPIYALNRDPANGLLGNVPGGLGAEATQYWLKSGGQELWAKFRRESMGLHSHVLGIGSTDLIHSHKPINSVADLKGMKFRTSGVFAQVLKDKLGGVPTTVPFSEIYTLLERKGIDAAEWSTPAEDYAVGLQKAAKYIVTPGFHSPASTLEFVIKADRWDALPEDIRKQVTLAADIATHEFGIKTGLGDIAAMNKVRQEGNEIITLPPEAIAEIRAKTREWIYEQAAKQTDKGNPWMKQLADHYYGFLDNWEKGSVYRFNRINQ